jgi:hypothetical protein
VHDEKKEISPEIKKEGMMHELLRRKRATRLLPGTDILFRMHFQFIISEPITGRRINRRQFIKHLKRQLL